MLRHRVLILCAQTHTKHTTCQLMTAQSTRAARPFQAWLTKSRRNNGKNLPITKKAVLHTRVCSTCLICVQLRITVRHSIRSCMHSLQWANINTSQITLSFRSTYGASSNSQGCCTRTVGTLRVGDQ